MENDKISKPLESFISSVGELSINKLAKDIEQPASFDDDYDKWLRMTSKEPETKKHNKKKLLEDAMSLLALEKDKLETDDKNVKNAKKDKKKLDPKAKVRNRGTVCVPASSAKDKKDHFPINSIDQARNALARVHQYSSVPSWYKGSLKGLQALVSRKVHSKYPSIGKEPKKTKKSDLSDLLDSFLVKTSSF